MPRRIHEVTVTIYLSRFFFFFFYLSVSVFLFFAESRGLQDDVTGQKAERWRLAVKGASNNDAVNVSFVILAHETRMYIEHDIVGVGQATDGFSYCSLTIERLPQRLMW